MFGESIEEAAFGESIEGNNPDNDGISDNDNMPKITNHCERF